jgi:hypothetical protein
VFDLLAHGGAPIADRANQIWMGMALLDRLPTITRAMRRRAAYRQCLPSIFSRPILRKIFNDFYS